MCPVSCAMCHVSCVRCHMSCVACHLSYVTNANSQSHGPCPCHLPYYAQQGAAADLDLDPSTMSCQDQLIYFFPRGYLRQLLNKNCQF